MKIGFRAQLGQQLNLTPQLLQSIRLLQLDATQLDAEVERALENNPLLERVVEDENPVPAAAHSGFDRIWVTASRTGHGSIGDEEALMQLPDRAGESIREYVLEQLRLELRDPRDQVIAEWLVEVTGDNGYLTQSNEELQATIGGMGIDPARIEAVRQRMLRCEPAGFGARTVSECLLVQLNERPAPVPGRVVARRAIENHFDLLSSDDDLALADALAIDAEQLAEIRRLIASLNPYPGRDRVLEPSTYVVPDAIIWRNSAGWQVDLNPVTAPRVRIGAGIEAALATAADDAEVQRLRGLLQEARWLTRGLGMRYETLLKVCRAMVERQQGFFEHGEEAMVPLTLREIGDAIGMHESSISRVTTGKYVQTPRGTFELKHFFTTRLEGAEVANVAVRAMVRRLIEAENPAAPLADHAIAGLLARQGIRIARRTVAKYRDQLHIASMKDRLRLHPASPRLATAG